MYIEDTLNFAVSDGLKFWQVRGTALRIVKGNKPVTLRLYSGGQIVLEHKQAVAGFSVSLPGTKQFDRVELQTTQAAHTVAFVVSWGAMDDVPVRNSDEAGVLRGSSFGFVAVTGQVAGEYSRVALRNFDSANVHEVMMLESLVISTNTAGVVKFALSDAGTQFANVLTAPASRGEAPALDNLAGLTYESNAVALIGASFNACGGGYAVANTPLDPTQSGRLAIAIPPGQSLIVEHGTVNGILRVSAAYRRLAL